jgi:uncharacterized membrane protein YkvA (DUF1232 family)
MAATGEVMGALDQARCHSPMDRRAGSPGAMVCKFVAACVAAYALSPIDLIPDFVPVLGYVDDIILVPLGIILAVRLIPVPLMEEFRATAAARKGRPVSRIGAVVVATIWLASAALLIWAFWLRD